MVVELLLAVLMIRVAISKFDRGTDKDKGGRNSTWAGGWILSIELVVVFGHWVS